MQCLLVIDVQNDFCQGGALAVAKADAIVPTINALMPDYDLVIFTQDWHPAGHSSFASTHGATPFSTTQMPYGEQVLWPDHCIIGTKGAGFHPALDTNAPHAIIRKGTNPAIDSYSAFFDNDKKTPTGLDGLLRTRGVERITMAGLATDYCVAWSALDAAKLGFEVEVLLQACRGIDLEGSYAKALDDMCARGVAITP